MKKILSLVLAFLLLGSYAEAESIDRVEGVWADVPGGYVHIFDDCNILLDEDGELIMGSMDQAVRAGKEYLCRKCVLRLAHAYDADVQVIGQQTLDDLSDSELQYFVAVYNAELLRRSAEAFELDPGIYIVGQDLPAGTYRIEMSAGLAGMADIYVYQTHDMYTSGNRCYQTMLSEHSNLTAIGKLYLGVDNVLEIDGKFIFTPYAGVERTGP